MLSDPSVLFAQTYVGTPYYMSPELISSEPYTAKSDIWALGCVLHELCSLAPPFQAKTQMALFQKIKDTHPGNIGSHYSADLQQVINWCLQKDEMSRPTVKDILSLDRVRTARVEVQNIELYVLVGNCQSSKKVGCANSKIRRMHLTDGSMS